MHSKTALEIFFLQSEFNLCLCCMTFKDFYIELSPNTKELARKIARNNFFFVLWRVKDNYVPKFRLLPPMLITIGIILS